MTWNKTKTIDELTLEDFKGVPRISSWIPKHADVIKIAEFMKLIKNPKVSCMACGNGFEAALLAQEGLDILGVDLNLSDENRYSNFPNLRLVQGDLMEKGPWYNERNIIFNSWMLGGQDWSSYFYNSKPGPKMIVYVTGKGPNGEGYTGLRPCMQNNPHNIDSYATPWDYIKLDEFPSFGAMDFKNTETPELNKPSCSILIQVKKGTYETLKKQLKTTKQKDFNEVVPYRWEAEMP
jgi:hypothetical protein